MVCLPTIPPFAGFEVQRLIFLFRADAGVFYSESKEFLIAVWRTSEGKITILPHSRCDI